jgi:putative SOS response-associated peptidase YedK
VPADAYYEWRAEGKVKRPFYFCLRDDEPFAFAGLWERW